jgi:hypothetical protein
VPETLHIGAHPRISTVASASVPFVDPLQIGGFLLEVETALDTRKSLGRLDRKEMRALVERFVSYWQFDLRQLLVAQIRELQHRRKAR